MAKLVTQRGQKAQCISNAEGLDRFSTLPDDIIHHIFSFLQIADMARVGVLSKACRRLFISNPYLDFTVYCSCRPDYTRNSCNQFSHDFVDGFLSQRHGMEICRLRLHWVCGQNLICDVDATKFIDKWMNIAASCCVQEIDIEIRGMYPFWKRFQLPQCIVSSKSLRILKLNLCDKPLKEPTGVFISVKELSLSRLVGSASGAALKKLISTSCPSLKSLTINDPSGIPNISFTSPCLEEFTLGDFRGHLMEIDISTVQLQKLSLDVHRSSCCTVKINAPNLQYMKWAVKAAREVYLSRFESLKSVSLKDIDCSSYFPNSMTDLLQRVCFARMLQINIDILETQFHNNCPSVEFGNLQRMVIKVNWLRNRQFPVLASILMRAPNLEFLKLECGTTLDSGSKASMVGTQHEGLDNQVDHQLKEIEIELYGGHEVGIIKDMLEFAKDLKKMTIFYTVGNSQALSKIGLDKSRAASLPFELNLECVCFVENNCQEDIFS